MRSLPRRSSAVLAIALASTTLPGCAGGDTPGFDVIAPVLAPSGDTPSLAAKRQVERAPEPRPVPRWAPPSPTWSFPLPVDHGLRTDGGGQGQFLAPRAHGKHNGIDMLAPVGTPVLAACNGKAKADQRGGYGRVVQLVCPVPSDIGGGDLDLHVSLFYAHLDKTQLSKTWRSVKAGQPMGTVGKTGNASSPRIMPHLHLEMIVRATEAEALAETHSGQNAKAARAADAFFVSLQDECIEPANLTARADVRRERRVDPFVMLLCAGRPKPTFSLPEAKPLREAAVKWSRFYESPAFDVDQGPRPPAKSDGG